MTSPVVGYAKEVEKQSQFPEASFDILILHVNNWWQSGTGVTFVEWMLEHA